MAFAKKASDHIPYCKDQGMSWLMGAGQAGLSVHAFKVVSGGSPDTVLFSALGLEDMADSSYLVIVQGETAARVTVDESTIAPTGFDILGGAGGEILHVLVVGKIKNQVG